MQISDHPTVKNLELTGYPDGKEPEYPHCPVCGRECEIIYKASDNEILGCDECVTEYFASEIDECFPMND